MKSIKQLMRRVFFVLLIAAFCMPVFDVGAAIGVNDKEVVIGMTNALEGPASALGSGIKRGSGVYMDKINKTGGVHGRKVTVISYKDGYEPELTVKATKKLINQDKVFVLFGYVGTPTSTAIRPLISISHPITL